MTNVADAQKVLSGLETKLADNRSWQLEIETASKSVSFDAHTAGGEARERLDSLNAQRVAAEQEARSIEIAVSEAKQRLQLAIAAETDFGGDCKSKTRARAVLRICRTWRGARPIADKVSRRLPRSLRRL